MINKLHVKSFAIIDDIEIDFKNNMTSITGQTGSGKSLIIDSIGLLLGARADLDMIRYGEAKAIIEGEFSYDNSKIDDCLSKYGIEKKSFLTIKREISQRSKISINDMQVSLNQLKEISQYLADIHVQNDTYKLVDPNNYMQIIDSYADKDFINIYNNYQMDLLNYREALKDYKELSSKNDDVIEKLDLLKFQYEELSSLDLKENELENITNEINVLLNYDKIYSNLKLAYDKLNSIDDLYEAYQDLKKISDYGDAYNSYYEKIMDSYYNLDDIRNEIHHSLSSMDFDKDYLEELQNREVELKKISKKYKMEINDLIKHIEKIKNEIDKAENYDEYVKNLFINLEKKHKILLESSNILQLKREEVSKKLQASLIKECKELDLDNINFEISFMKHNTSNPLDSSSFLDSGISDVDFLVSLNKGEPVKPLSKVASGGELSRIMLGLKTVLASKSNLGLIVFDEIDTGTSGETASKIANKMKKISMNTQVLCITHLPHVAAVADNQLFISKYEENDRTFTKIIELTLDDRIKEIAKMISGDKISPNSIASAKELLKA